MPCPIVGQGSVSAREALTAASSIPKGIRSSRCGVDLYYSKNIKYIILISPQSPSTFHRMDSHTVGSSVISGEKARPLFIRARSLKKRNRIGHQADCSESGHGFRPEFFITPQKRKRLMSGETMTAEIEKRPLSMIVNGKEVGPIDVPVGMPMIDFLHHYLNLTGTHFGCGQGVCHACTVLEVQPDGRLVDTRTCIANAHAFNGKTIITIEGQAKTDAEGNVTELTPIQKAFIEKFSFQCGYCTPGFVAGATAFIDRLKHEPVKRADLESAIEDALNDHICRCTGYVRYYEAVRDVALATPGCVIGSVD